VIQAILRYSPVFVAVVIGIFQCLSCIFASWTMTYNQRKMLLQGSGLSGHAHNVQTVRERDDAY
jgi:hypothetical protein